MMDDEVLVPVEGYPNYAVSNLGRVVNIKTDTDLKPGIQPNGQRKVILYREAVPRSFFVHRLVAQAFFVNYSDDHLVAPINGDYSDCTVRNIHLTKIKKGKKRGNT